MPSILVSYDDNGIAVATGETPDDPDTPIDGPEDCFVLTNQRSVFAAGSHCFTLLTEDRFSPLWICLELQEGDDKTIHFHRI